MSRAIKLALAALSTAVIAGGGFIAGATLIAASPTAPSIGGKGAGCGPGPIHCSAEQIDAFGFWSENVPPYSSFNVNPSRGQFVIRPRGGPAFVSPVETTVFLQVSSPTVNGFGCFVVPDSAFVVSRDLQSATLQATLNTPCGGFVTPLLADTQAAPAGPGVPPGGGLPLGIVVNVTWKGPGAPFVSTSTSSQHCDGFTSTFHIHGSSSESIASGTLTFPDNSVQVLGASRAAGVDDFSTLQNANGAPGPECVIP